MRLSLRWIVVGFALLVSTLMVRSVMHALKYTVDNGIAAGDSPGGGDGTGAAGHKKFVDKDDPDLVLMELSSAETNARQRTMAPLVRTDRLRDLHRPSAAEVAARRRGTRVERFATPAAAGRAPSKERFLANLEMPEAQRRLNEPHPWVTRWGDGIHGATTPRPEKGQCAVVPHRVPIEMLVARSGLTGTIESHFSRKACERRAEAPDGGAGKKYSGVPDAVRDPVTGELRFDCPPWTEGEWRPVEFDVATGREIARNESEPWSPERTARMAGRWETVLARCRRANLEVHTGILQTITERNPIVVRDEKNRKLQGIRMFTDHLANARLAKTAARARERHRAELRAAAAKAQRSGAQAEQEPPKLPPVYDDPPNINLVILDGVSRANFYRTMPKLANYLDNLHTESAGTYESFELRRFHAVECCSYGNQTPLLSGVFIREGEFRYQPKRLSPKWMWNLARKHGYVTSHGIGMCVHPHWAPWELNPAVDRFFVEPFCVQGHEFVYAIGERPCILGHDIADVVLTDAERFFATYPDDAAGKFVFSVLLHGHEPTLSVPRAAEDRMILHLQRLIEDHPNTVHIVTSDHGIGWSDYAATRTGQLERALPFAFILMPTGAWGEREKVMFFFFFFFCD
jgi:hypothetical protein